MTLSVLECHSLLQAFSSAIFRICGASHGPSASAELLVLRCCSGSSECLFVSKLDNDNIMFRVPELQLLCVGPGYYWDG